MLSRVLRDFDIFNYKDKILNGIDGKCDNGLTLCAMMLILIH